MSALFVDLDLAEGEAQESALEAMRELELAPSLVVQASQRGGLVRVTVLGD